MPPTPMLSALHSHGCDKPGAYTTFRTLPGRIWSAPHHCLAQDVAHVSPSSGAPLHPLGPLDPATVSAPSSSTFHPIAPSSSRVPSTGRHARFSTFASTKSFGTDQVLPQKSAHVQGVIGLPPRAGTAFADMPSLRASSTTWLAHFRASRLLPRDHNAGTHEVCHHTFLASAR